MLLISGVSLTRNNYLHGREIYVEIIFSAVLERLY